MKYVLSAFLLCLIFISCDQAVQKADSNPHEKLVRQFFETFNRHEWTKMADMYTPTADFKDPSLGTAVVKQTRQQTIDKYTALQQTFPDIHDSLTQLYPSGEKNIIAEFISSGTAPDGSKFSLPICTIFTIENGLITKDYTYYDNMEEPEAAPPAPGKTPK
jgi:ketosteroid isomerase-like protein